MIDNRDNYFENPDVEMWLNNGIIHSRLKQNTTIKQANAKAIVQGRLGICNGKSYPLLSDVRNIKAIDKEARAYLAAGESLHLVSAGAILINSLAQEVGANFFLNFDRPKVPAKFFTCEEKAIEWLASFK
ncbi:MAG TPA: hypothetical protein VF691_19175 [Cytophagaceae bacterium]|jgi:hypothetical protein